MASVCHSSIARLVSPSSPQRSLVGGLWLKIDEPLTIVSFSAWIWYGLVLSWRFYQPDHLLVPEEHQNRSNYRLRTKGQRKNTCFSKLTRVEWA
jgi:hypothetical protein